MSLFESAQKSAINLADQLKGLSDSKTIRIVFAESCTSGLVAALLGQVPGISNFLCGSAVTYRESVKQQWLSVSSKTITQFSAESFETTREMATGVLSSTSEANFSAAVTGHLGPDAPPEVDGKIFIVVASQKKLADNGRSENPRIILEKMVKLDSTERVDRQHESAQKVFECFFDTLERI